MSAIKPGDMVMLVYGCCWHAIGFIGHKYIVEGIEHGLATCETCGTDTDTGPHAWIREGGEPAFVPLPWLIKLEPGEEVTTEKPEAIDA